MWEYEQANGTRNYADMTVAEKLAYWQSYNATGEMVDVKRKAIRHLSAQIDLTAASQFLGSRLL